MFKKSITSLVTLIIVGLVLSSCVAPLPYTQRVTTPIYFESIFNDSQENENSYKILEFTIDEYLYKSSGEVDLTSKISSLETAANAINSDGKPTQGLNAAVGYYYLVYGNDTAKAKNYFSREVKYYPVSKGYISNLLNKAKLN